LCTSTSLDEGQNRCYQVGPQTRPLCRSAGPSGVVWTPRKGYRITYLNSVNPLLQSQIMYCLSESAPPSVPLQPFKRLTCVIVLLIIGQPACPGGPPRLLGRPGALKGLLTPNSSPEGRSMKLSGSGGGGGICICPGAVFIG
jgi:hypothetical protein